MTVVRLAIVGEDVYWIILLTSTVRTGAILNGQWKHVSARRRAIAQVLLYALGGAYRLYNLTFVK